MPQNIIPYVRLFHPTTATLYYLQIIIYTINTNIQEDGQGMNSGGGREPIEGQVSFHQAVLILRESTKKRRLSSKRHTNAK